MFNTGGAIEEVEVHLSSEKKPEPFDGDVLSEVTTYLSKSRSPSATVELKVRGRGRFGAYCSQPPLKCTVDNIDTTFIYDTDTGLVSLNIPVPEEELYRWHIEIQV